MDCDNISINETGWQTRIRCLEHKSHALSVFAKSNRRPVSFFLFFQIVLFVSDNNTRHTIPEKGSSSLRQRQKFSEPKRMIFQAGEWMAIRLQLRKNGKKQPQKNFSLRGHW